MSLVSVHVFSTKGDAEIASARLRAAGIGSMVRAEDEGGLNPGFFGTYGVRLVVRAEDLDAARTTLGIGDLVLHREMVEAMVQHSRFCAPEEACGLLAVDAEGAVCMVYCCSNVDGSPHRYTVDPAEQFHAWRHAEARGWEIGGVFHSHPGGEAWPSQTDIERALDPSWWYVIVGRDRVRAFRIHGAADEVAVVVRR